MDAVRNVEVYAEFFLAKISGMKSMSNLILAVEVCCHKVQGMTEAFTDTLYNRAKTSSSVPYLPLFSSETADKFAKDYAIKKSFYHALQLVTGHLHRQNQVAHAVRTRDFWLTKLSIHFPIHFTRCAHEYPITLSFLCIHVFVTPTTTF